jgi:uncharacterized protein (DUF1499 family)
MRIVKWLILVVAGLALLGVAAGQLGLLRGRAPGDLGVKEGKLKAPSTTPNSVSSQAELWPGHPQRAYARIAPLALAGEPGAVMARVRAAVEATPGAVVVKADGDYLYAQFTTPLMHYTDDVEFWFDRALGVVQLRSASRLGEGDMGANRLRIEALRSRLGAP